MLPYQFIGNGHPLLLIHGWGVTYKVWHKLVPLLAPHFQLILVELPGVGEACEVVSSKPYYPACAEDLEKLRLDLGIEQWAILAYSTGTRVAEAYVQQYPHRVTRAVFLCPIYLREPWQIALKIEQWIDSKRSELANWILSEWRLYCILLFVGFNLHQHYYADEWMSEIELQPLENLKRMVLELPGKGRAPFTLPTSPPVPTLFVWSRYDVLTARPFRPRSNDVIISANHSAPVLAPHLVAASVLPFLKEGDMLQNNMTKRGKKDLLIQTEHSA